MKTLAELQAIRDRDLSAEIIGVQPTRYKVAAFAIAGATIFAIHVGHTRTLFPCVISLSIFNISITL